MSLSTEDVSTETNEQAAAEAAEATAPAELTTQSAEAKTRAPEPVKKSCSPGLTTWMRRNQVSIAFTSYQSGRLYLLGSDATGKLSFHERIYQRAMGVAQLEIAARLIDIETPQEFFGKIHLHAPVLLLDERADAEGPGLQRGVERPVELHPHDAVDQQQGRAEEERQGEQELAGELPAQRLHAGERSPTGSST